MCTFRPVFKGCRQGEIGYVSGQGNRAVHGLCRGSRDLTGGHAFLIQFEPGDGGFTWRSIPPFHMDGVAGRR